MKTDSGRSWAHIFLNADLAEQADLGRSERERIFLFRVLFVWLVCFVVSFLEAEPRTTRTTRKRREKECPKNSDPVFIRLIRPIRVQKKRCARERKAKRREQKTHAFFVWIFPTRWR